MILIQLSTHENEVLDVVPYMQTAVARFAALGIPVEHSDTTAFREFRGDELVGNVIYVELHAPNASTSRFAEALARVETALKALAKDANRVLKVRLLVSVEKESTVSDVAPTSDKAFAATGC